MKKMGVMLCLVLLSGMLSGCLAPLHDSVSKEERGEAAVRVDNLNPSGLQASMMSAGPEMLLTDIDYTQPALAGDRIWFSGDSRADRSPALVGVATDGTEHTLFRLMFPEADSHVAEDLPEGETAAVTYQLLDSSDSLPLLLRRILHISADEENYQLYGTEYFFSRIDEVGGVEEGVNLSVPYETSLQYPCVLGDVLWFCTSAWNAENNNLVTPQLVGCSVQDGNLVAALDLPDDIYVTGLQALADGRLWMLAIQSKTADGQWNSMDLGLYPIQISASEVSLGEFFPVPTSIATGEVGFVRTVSQQDVWLYGAGGLYRWAAEAGSCKLEHRWLDTGIRSDSAKSVAPSSAFLCSDSSFLLVNYTYDFTSMRDVAEIWILGEGTSTPADERTVLRIGSLCSDNRALLSAAAAFNNSNAEIRVEIVTYTTEAAAEQGAVDGITLLEREILSGKGPDVIVTSAGENMIHLSGKGAFLDLYPLLDSDPELSREDFVAGPLSAGEVNGSLYSVIPEYGLISVVGSAEKLGEAPGWTWEEFYQSTQNAELPFWGLGRDVLLHYFLQAGGSRFVDYANSKANFDSEEFIRLLNDMSKYPESMPFYTSSDQKARFSLGESLVSVCYPKFENMIGECYTFDGPVVYKGFPTDDGSGSLLLPNLQLSICSATKNSEAAWAFVRSFLRQEYQNGIYLGLPLRRDALEAMALQAQQPYVDDDPDDGMNYRIPAYLDQATTNQEMIDYWSRGLTQEETKQILEVAEKTDTIFHYNSTIYDIVMESAAAFFAGQNTAEEAAKLIQSRVQTYLAEQG